VPGKIGVGPVHEQILDGGKEKVGRWPVPDAIDHPQQVGILCDHLDQVGVERGSVGVLAPIPQVLRSDRRWLLH
jgi:hypothetical protein